MVEMHVLEGGGFEVEPALWCVLERGHGGLHHTPGQALPAGGGMPSVMVWLRWPDGDAFGPSRELLVLPHCPEQFLEGCDAAEACGLPEGHAGRHGWEFGPPVTSADLPPGWLL